MKKVLVFTLLLVYTTFASGITLQLHYCQGKLKSISFFGKEKENDCCGSKIKKTSCCDNKTSFFKVNDNHSPAQELRITPSDYLTNFFGIIHITVPSFFSSNESELYSYTHAPPLMGKYPIYLSVCNFRI